MRSARAVVFGLLALNSTGLFAGSSAPAVPAYMLTAHTVAVVIDPHAGISLSDPNLNQTALEDVESALQQWGRFQLVTSPRDADLVIVIRKVSGKLADETIPDPRRNTPAGAADGSVWGGASRGRLPGDPSAVPNPPADTAPAAQVGNQLDAFLVFQGRFESDDSYNNEDTLPGWSWVRRNGLHPHDVPAVAEFRKALEEAEKQAASQKKKHP